MDSGVGNFTDEEILDLCAEMGQDIAYCTQQIVQAAMPQVGVKERSELVCRPVRGYVIPERRFEVPIANMPSSDGGNYRAYLSSVDISHEQLMADPQARIKFDGKAYQLEYIRGHIDRGTVRLHELRLLQTKSTSPEL